MNNKRSFKAHYIMHAPFESLGVIEQWSKKRGYFMCSHKTYQGEILPNPEEVDFLISMGGPQSAINWREYPYLVQEVALMQTLMAKGCMILGICLGAQLLGIANGAVVEPSPYPEVGVFPIKLTEEGHKDPIASILSDNMPVLHWHSDMVQIPKGAKVLAKSEGCPRQMIRFSDKAYGFQCHLEADALRVKDFIRNSPQELKMTGPYIAQQKEIENADYSKMNEALFKIMDVLVEKL